MDMIIPPLIIKIMLESNPLKSNVSTEIGRTVGKRRKPHAGESNDAAAWFHVHNDTSSGHHSQHDGVEAIHVPCNS